jgi:BolA protein
MSVRDVIVEKLSVKFTPSHLEVIDESARHAGHAGARAEGESHFRVRIAAPGLVGKSRLEQHRQINAALADEFAAGLHALAIEIIR